MDLIEVLKINLEKKINLESKQLNRIETINMKNIVFATGKQLWKTKFEQSNKDSSVKSFIFDEIQNIKLPSKHDAEIQEIKIYDNVLFSIDSLGKINIQRLNPIFKDNEKYLIKKKKKINCINFFPVKFPSYAGITYCNNNIAICHHSESYLGWLDVNSGKLIKLVRTIKKPNGINIFNTNLLCCIEQDTITIWDNRNPKKNGKVNSIQFKNVYLWSITTLLDGKIAVAGNEKTVFIVDPRKWKNIINLRIGVKSDLLKVLPSLNNPKIIYSVGVDHDLVCRSWFRKKEVFMKDFGKALHVDSSWASINIMNNNHGSEIIIGLTMKGTLFLVFKPYQLNII